MRKANNCKIDPVLYTFYLRLKNELGAVLVHRRRRSSSTCIEIIFTNGCVAYITGRLNSLREAEKCGFWVISRRQTKRGHTAYHGLPVFQLFLTPVHPKKRNEAKHLAAPTVEEVSFAPIRPTSHPALRIRRQVLYRQQWCGQEGKSRHTCPEVRCLRTRGWPPD